MDLMDPRLMTPTRLSDGESQTTAAAAAVSRLRVGGEKEIRFAPGGSGGTRDRVRVTGQRGGVS